MVRIIIALLYITVAYKSGAFKKWKEYYSTALYVIIGDLSYNFIFYNHTLWQFENLVSHTFSTFLVSFFIFPCMILVFFSHYPKGFWKQILYIIGFTLVNSIIEFISFKTGNITYHNNWGLFWSVGVFFFMFILARLHYKYPLIVWPISAGFALLTMYIFKIPFGIIK
jgi:hypothetical protein